MGHIFDTPCVNASGKAPMHGAAENGHLHVVQCLLEAGAKLGAGEWEPMHLAAKNLCYTSEVSFGQFG